MKKNLLLAAVAASLSVSAFAIPNPIPSASELPVFNQFDTQITVPSWDNREIYQYSPETTGVLTVYSESTKGEMELFVSTIYDQEDYTCIGEQYNGEFIEDLPAGYNYGYAYEVTPDKTYFISLPMRSDATVTTTVMFTFEAMETGEASLSLVEPNPTMASAFDYNTYNDVLFTCTQPISSFESVTFSYLDQEINMEGYARIVGTVNTMTHLQVQVAAVGRTNFVAQAADAGAESFTITVTGLKAVGTDVTINATGNESIVVENGKVSVTYAVAQAASYEQELSYWPETFYEYWEEGNPTGIAKMVFTQPIARVSNASVTMGAVTPGTEGGENVYETYTIKPTIEGNTVFLDFTGFERPSDARMATVVVTGVVGENGLIASLGGNVFYKQIPFVAGTAPEGSVGVESLINEGNLDGAVYNLNGVKVGESLEGLAPGIYILNGHKVLVK